MSRENLQLPFSFLNRDALDALYGDSPDGVMVECFDTPISQDAIATSNPPVEVIGIAEIVYTNKNFMTYARDYGITTNPADKKALQAALLQMFDDDFVVRWRRRPGTYIDNLPVSAHTDKASRQAPPLLLSATPITHAGKVYGCCIRVTDASSAVSRSAEETRALKQIEAFVRTENVPLVCLEFATPLPRQVSVSELGQAYMGATLTHVTDSASALFGATPAKVLRKSLQDASNKVLHSLMANAFPETTHAELLNLGDTSEILVPATATGTVFKVKPTFVFEDDKAVEAWLRIEDETSKQRTLRHQKRLERTRTMALQGASLYQFEVDSQTMTIHSDVKGLEAIGFTNTTSKLSAWLEKLGPEDVSISKDRMLRQIKGEEKQLNFVVRLLNSSDEERYIEFWGETISSDKNGEAVPRVLGLFRDITETQKLNARLRDKKTLESLGVLAGGVAHDFNNMLMSVLGYAELMEADMLESPERDSSTLINPALKNIAEIRAAALRASDLCTSLLAYAGQHLIEKKALNLTELVRTTSELVQLTIGKQVPLIWRLEEEVWVSADQGQLTQVIVNLVGNAADAMTTEDHGLREGAVTISSDTVVLSAAEQKQLEEPISPPGEPVACLTVVDHGIGMSQATVQRMFEPFFTTKAEGRGLGMAAVHGIVKHHYGGILVDTAEGEGTTFRVCLPVAARVPTAEHNIATTESVPVVEKPSILVVDDERSVRRIAAEMLRHLECEVQEADSAEAALALFDTYRFDYVLLDITMPVMSGNELAELLLQRNPQLTVVLCSGYTEKNVDNALLARCTFIHKPFTLQEVREALNLDEV